MPCQPSPIISSPHCRIIAIAMGIAGGCSVPYQQLNDEFVVGPPITIQVPGFADGPALPMASLPNSKGGSTRNTKARVRRRLKSRRQPKIS
jgi:hypothetical protein